ncbi:flippase-like domain-containing protein [Candidatus Dojkabacteria bacterium]|nr:flippase-like domain-containing protein [Candidatus Dojkabacteria bacterium]
MEKIRSKKITLVLFIIILLGLVFYIYINYSEFSKLTIKNPILLIPLSCSIILFLAINGLVNYYLLKIFNVKLAFKEWFGLSVINTMGNYLFPFRGGTISNAVYLKGKHQFPYSSFISILSATYILVFWVISIVGTISLLIIKFMYNVFSIPLTVVFIFSFIFLTVIIAFSPTIKETPYKTLNTFIKIINDWKGISSHKRTLLIVASITFVNILLTTFNTYLEFQILGKEVSFIKLVLLSVFSSFSLFISITPGNIGIREAFSAYSGNVVGLLPAEVITVSIIDRAVTFALSFILGLYFSYILTKRRKKN